MRLNETELDFSLSQLDFKDALLRIWERGCEKSYLHLFEEETKLKFKVENYTVIVTSFYGCSKKEKSFKKRNIRVYAAKTDFMKSRLWRNLKSNAPHRAIMEVGDRPFPKYLWPLFQSESWCPFFLKKISFTCKNLQNFIIDSFPFQN